MAIATLHRTFSRTLLLLGVISLVACGGGGGGKKAKDTTPEAFSFTASTNAATSAVVTSPAVAITGIDAPAAVAITGGQYSINGGAFTSATGKVTSGQTIAVKVTASSVTNTPVEAILTVGGVRATFRVTTAPDLTPAAYNFVPATDAALSIAITSAPVTLSGFDLAVPISITNGEYSINGGAFTSAAGTISPAQTLAVKVVSSNTNSTPVEATLNVGGVTATYRVTTLADTIPNVFTFTAATNAALSSVNTSNTITVEGIDAASPIAVTGGEYSISGGAFTAAAGTVAGGQTITVKAVAPAGTELTQNAVVTIGGVNATYSVTTIPDTTAPVAEFKFPTPYTMSEASTVKVRGTATDEHAITSVKVVVNGVDVPATPKSPGDFSSWTADVPLTAFAENEIKVVATDDRNNQTAIGAANKVKIKQAVIDAPGFPDASVELGRDGLILDKQQGRARLLVGNANDQSIIATDLATGVRSVFVSIDPDCYISTIAADPIGQRLYSVCENKLQEYNLADGSFIEEHDFSGISLDNSISAMAVDRSNGRAQLVMVEHASPDDDSLIGGAVIAFSLSNKTFSVISAANQLPLMNTAVSIIPDGDRYLIINGARNPNANMHSVLAVNAITGIHSIISSNTVGTGEAFSGGIIGYNGIGLQGAAIHRLTNQLFVNEYTTGKLFSIDIETGNRSVFKVFPMQRSTIFNEDVLPENWDMSVDETSHNLFVHEAVRDGILVIDIETKEQVVLTKSENDF